MEKFKIEKTLGDGTFGKVYKAKNLSNGEDVAIKNMKKKFRSWDECVNLREVKALRKLIHPNIIRLKEVVKANDELNLIFEYCEDNLYQMYMSYRQKKKYLEEKLIRNIVHQIVLGLVHMHKHGFFHRDLKPENILFNNNNVKIIDFGLAREIRSRPPFTDYVSTRWYRAPELLVRSTTYNSQVDIFALGCIIAELYNLTPLFCGNSELDQLHKIFQILGTPTKQEWGEGYKLASRLNVKFPQFNKQEIEKVVPRMCKEGHDLLKQIFQFDGLKRPSIQIILGHPYFTHYNIETGNYKPQHQLVDQHQHVNHQSKNNLYGNDINFLAGIGEHGQNNQQQQHRQQNLLQNLSKYQDSDQNLDSMNNMNININQNQNQNQNQLGFNNSMASLRNNNNSNLNHNNNNAQASNTLQNFAASQNNGQLLQDNNQNPMYYHEQNNKAFKIRKNINKDLEKQNNDSITKQIAQKNLFYPYANQDSNAVLNPNGHHLSKSLAIGKGNLYSNIYQNSYGQKEYHKVNSLQDSDVQQNYQNRINNFSQVNFQQQTPQQQTQHSVDSQTMKRTNFIGGQKGQNSLYNLNYSNFDNNQQQKPQYTYQTPQNILNVNNKTNTNTNFQQYLHQPQQNQQQQNIYQNANYNVPQFGQKQNNNQNKNQIDLQQYY